MFECEQAGFGFYLHESGALWVVGSWADDNIITAEDHCSATAMLASLHRRSQAHRWRMAWEDSDKYQYMENEFAQRLPSAAAGVLNPVTGKQLAKVTAMKILGVTFDARDPQSTAVEARTRAAWANLRSRHPLFCQRNICRFARMCMLEAVIRPTLLWGGLSQWPCARASLTASAGRCIP